MCPAMNLAIEESNEESRYQKGVRHLCENGITKVPRKYILPVSDRPVAVREEGKLENLNLPIIDFAQLQGPNRSQVLNSLAKACEEYGFFQLVNHGIGRDIIDQIIKEGKEFFDLPFNEREKYMSADIKAPVRHGTSFNQNKDGVFCWRDFLKLSCHSLSTDLLSLWPSSPQHLREAGVNYSKQTKFLYQLLIEAILESLGIVKENDETNDNLKEFEGGSQLLVLNCYPCCPEPELTLGMPPHSDYGLLTLLLQDEVKGLQIQHQGNWLTVEPIPNSFVVNVGDHLEIFSNGRYKSVLHRVLVNSSKPRISVASLHSLPYSCKIQPSPNLINESNPKLYEDTDFATFLEYLASCEHKSKSFLESRKIDLNGNHDLLL